MSAEEDGCGCGYGYCMHRVVAAGDAQVGLAVLAICASEMWAATTCALILPAFRRSTSGKAPSTGLGQAQTRRCCQSAPGAARGENSTVQAQQLVRPGLLSPLRTCGRGSRVRPGHGRGQRRSPHPCRCPSDLSRLADATLHRVPLPPAGSWVSLTTH